MAPPVLHIPKDIFIRLRSCFGQGPNQGILYGVREECFGKGLVLHVKGFTCYTSSNKDLLSTISRLINFQGQTVLGWFSNPDAETLSTFTINQVADAYFETFQSAILKVLSATYLHLTSDLKVDSFSNRITADCSRFFQDLVGLIIYRSTDACSKKKNFCEELESYKITTCAFYSHVAIQDIHSAIYEMNKRVHPDQLEETILRELKSIRSRFKTERIHESNLEISDSNLSEHLSSSRRIADGLEWSPTDFVPEHNVRRNEPPSKRTSSEPSNSRTTKKHKVGSISLDSVQVLSGQGSEFISQSMNADSLHYSTEFDEMAFGMDSICQNSAERLEQLRSRKAMIESFIDNTCDLVDSYEHSCREYEMLLHCLQVLSEPLDVLKHRLGGVEQQCPFLSGTNNPSDEEDISSNTSRDHSSNLEHDPESTDTEPERHLMVRLTTEATTDFSQKQD